MKILFVGDYSNLHSTLAPELRRRGHRVSVLSDRCAGMDIDCDIPLVRGNGVFSGFSYLYKIFATLPKLKGFDIVQFINPGFLSLRPGKLRYFLRELKRENGSLFLTLAGNDHFFVRACLEPDFFRFSEFRVGVKRSPFDRAYPNMANAYLLPSLKHYTEDFYDAMDGAMSALPEYDMAARPILGDRLVYAGLPVDLKMLTPHPFPETGKIRLLVGMRSYSILQKGTDTLLKMARTLEKEMPERFETDNVTDLPWTEYLRHIREAHIVLDQLYSYSPGMNALNTMALGRVSASGAEPEYYDMIGETELRPIIPLSPLQEDIPGTLVKLAENPDLLRKMAADGRRLVEKHNDVRIIADRYEAHWQKILNRGQ